MTTNINKLNNTNTNSISTFLTSQAVKNKVNAIVGDSKKGAKFISSLVSAVNQNKELQNCEPGSLINSALLGEALNLSPSPQLGHYYIVPYNNKKENVKVATFMLGLIL